MSTRSEIEAELKGLIKAAARLLELSREAETLVEFGTCYQDWYSRAVKLVALLGPDRLEEFKGYYQIDPKRKNYSYANYVIQDYVKGVGARADAYGKPAWDIYQVVPLRIVNQVQIVQSLESRIDSVLADVYGRILADIEDQELAAADGLKKVSPRAAGTLAGVLLERHLQRVAVNHGVKIAKRTPTLSDLNDPLRAASVYSITTWRRIQLLADLRNLCAHNKEREPTAQEVDELLSGVNSIIKTVV